MRNWINLLEMPLASINLHGKWDSTADETHMSIDYDERKPKNSFRAPHDRRLVTNTRIQERVAELLKRFPTPIDLHFWNSTGALYFYRNLDYGEVDGTAKAKMPNSLKTVMANLDSSAITILLAHNEGGDNIHPLTPWMILHRISHALGGIGGEFSQNNFYNIKDRMHRCYEGETKDYNKNDFAFEFFNSICTFKAARERKVSDETAYGEGFTDMLVQYMVKGQVIFNPLPSKIVLDGNEFILKDEYTANSMYKTLVKNVNQHCAEVLQNAIGRAFIC